MEKLNLSDDARSGRGCKEEEFGRLSNNESGEDGDDIISMTSKTSSIGKSKSILKKKAAIVS